MLRFSSGLVIGWEEVVEEKGRPATGTERPAYRMDRFVPAFEER